MLLMVNSGLVSCPVCLSCLSLVKEQDKRVAVMRHVPSRECVFSERSFRVDRLNGNSDEVNYEKGQESLSA